MQATPQYLVGLHPVCIGCPWPSECNASRELARYIGVLVRRLGRDAKSALGGMRGGGRRAWRPLAPSAQCALLAGGGASATVGCDRGTWLGNGDDAGPYKECNSNMGTEKHDYVDHAGPYKKGIGFAGTQDIDFDKGADPYQECNSETHNSVKGSGPYNKLHWVQGYKGARR